MDKWINTDLSKDFTILQVAQKHGWPEYLVWSQALVKGDVFDRFKALQWGIWTWDVWNFMEYDPRFGDDWPGDAGAWTWMTTPPPGIYQCRLAGFSKLPSLKICLISALTFTIIFHLGWDFIIPDLKGDGRQTLSPFLFQNLTPASPFMADFSP